MGNPASAMPRPWVGEKLPTFESVSRRRLILLDDGIGSQMEPGGHVHELGERAGFHLSHHPATVCFHRDLADTKLATDLFVQLSGDHPPHDLSFATAQRLVPVPQRADVGLLTQGSMTARDGAPDGAQ